MDKLSVLWGLIRGNANRIIGVAVFVLTAALYLRTVGPTLGGGIDSAEYQHIAYTLGIAHPTGYPLYMVLGKIFTTLFAFGNIAYRMNVLSALIGAGAAVFVFLAILQLTGRRTVAIAGAAVFVVNLAMWRQEDANVHISPVDSSGKTWQEWNSRPIAFYPTSHWQPGELLKGYYDLLLPTTLPSGVMTLRVGLSPQNRTPIVKTEIVQ